MALAMPNTKYRREKVRPLGYKLKVNLGGDNSVDAQIDIVSLNIVKSIAAGIAVADLLGMQPADIQHSLAGVKSFEGRMQLLRGVKNSTIIDDTYNSSPIAAEAALMALYDFQAPQKIAILGMMNELGDYSKEAHEKLGRLCDPSKLDLLVTIGKDANSFLAAAAEAGGCNVKRADSPFQAGKIAIEFIKNNAAILVKGSQNGVFAEETVKILLADPLDSNKLVRQSPFWLKKKREQF